MTRVDRVMALALRVSAKQTEYGALGEELDRLKKEFALLVGEEDPQPTEGWPPGGLLGPNSTPEVKALVLAKMGAGTIATVTRNTPGRVLDVLASHPGREFSPGDVAGQLPDIPPKLVRTTLIRLHFAKRIEKVQRGSYRVKPKAEDRPMTATEQ